MTLFEKIVALNAYALDSANLLIDIEDGLDWRTVSNYYKTINDGIGWVACANRQVLSELIQAVKTFVYGGVSPSGYYLWESVHYGLYMQEQEITWKTICEAWAKNDFEGRVMTIAFIDRMRQILWDEPYFVAWASRPEQEGG